RGLSEIRLRTLHDLVALAGSEIVACVALPLVSHSLVITPARGGEKQGQGSPKRDPSIHCLRVAPEERGFNELRRRRPAPPVTESQSGNRSPRSSQTPQSSVSPQPSSAAPHSTPRLSHVSGLHGEH